MFTCSQDGAGYLDSLKIYHVAASKQCGAGGGGLAFTSSGVGRRLCERPHESTLLPKSSFLKAQLCGVEIFGRFHQAAIRAESPRLSNWNDIRKLLVVQQHQPPRLISVQRSGFGPVSGQCFVREATPVCHGRLCVEFSPRA